MRLIIALALLKSTLLKFKSYVAYSCVLQYCLFGFGSICYLLPVLRGYGKWFFTFFPVAFLYIPKSKPLLENEIACSTLEVRIGCTSGLNLPLTLVSKSTL